MPPGYMQLRNGPPAGVLRTGSGPPARSSIDPAQMPRPDAAGAQPTAQVFETRHAGKHSIPPHSSKLIAVRVCLTRMPFSHQGWLHSEHCTRLLCVGSCVSASVMWVRCRCATVGAGLWGRQPVQHAADAELCALLS